jgi:hypothetical protein
VSAENGSNNSLSNQLPAQSTHSRAARRASSPSVDIDKSLTSLPRVESDEQRDSVLAERANAGVTKKKPKPKSKSRTQRLRQEKGSERAEIVMDQLEKKVAGSVKRGKNVNARRVWLRSPWHLEKILTHEFRPIGRI